MSTPGFYTKQQLLPQSQSPDQLSAWLSGKHPGYDLVVWCFYGNLVSKAEDSDKLNVDAIAYMTQFVINLNLRVSEFVLFSRDLCTTEKVQMDICVR